jgi:hypothetical protein
MSTGTRYLQQVLDQGWVPIPQLAGSGLPGRMPISDRDQLYNFLVSEAGEGRFGLTQQDIYEFFTQPGESEAIAAAQDRFLNYRSQGMRASRQGGGQLASRLGIGGGLGERMGRAIAADFGGREAAAGFAASTAQAVEGINQPGRFALSDRIGSTLAQHYADSVSDAEAVGSGFEGAGRGMQQSNNPILMGIGWGVELAAKAGKHFASKDLLEQGRDAARRYSGRGLRPANFASLIRRPGSTGFTYTPGGSNEQALSQLFAPQEQESDNFLYGA